MPVKTVTIGKKEMDYLRFGREDGGTFVILPGVSLKSVMNSAEAIVSAYALLAEQYDIYLFDHIREEPEGYTIEGMAEDTLAAMEQLGLETFLLMGVSMGGMVAQTIAGKAPEKVKALILCSTAMNMAHSDRETFAKWQALAEQKNAAGLMEAFGESVYTPSFYETYKDAIIALGEGTTDLDFQNFLISLNAIRNFDIQNKAKKIDGPVLVIGAGADRVLGTQASYDLIETLHADSFFYEGCGHGVYDEAPDYLTHIDAFLRK